MKSASCKAKGRLLQNHVCNLIRNLFHLSDPDVKPAIMGESGMDIKLSAHARTLFGYACECKNTEKINVYEFWHQAEANAEKEQLEPLLILKKNREKPLVVMDADRAFCLFQELASVKGLLKEGP